MKTFVVVFLALLCLIAQEAIGTVRRVPSQYPTIQAAINASSNGDTVLVAEGRYFENIVLTKKITVGSTFVLDNDTSHISRTIIDGSQPRHPDSMAVVTIDGATDTTTVLAGFTITGGKGNRRDINYPPWPLIPYRGGIGIDIAGGGARIHHNIVRANNHTNTSAYFGGAIEIFDPTDRNGVSYAIIEHNSVVDNTLVGQEVDGGAFAIGHSSAIRKNLIARNTVRGTDLGIGGGFQIWNGFVNIEGNLVMDNSASHEGGGIQATSVSELSVAPIVSMANNIFARNSAGTVGGGCYVANSSAAVSMINNTFTANTAVSGGSGISIQNGASVRALNTILWDTVGTEIHTSSGGSLIAAYSDIRGGFAGSGNINADPRFVDITCRLSDFSTCIGAGSDSLQIGGVWYRSPSLCFYGGQRPDPTGSHPDIGACENPRANPITGGSETPSLIPTTFALEQNYPNPFNPTTTINYQLPTNSYVTLKVFDILGREVVTLVDGVEEAGYHNVQWSTCLPAGTADNRQLSSGVYMYRLQAGEFSAVRRMLLIK